MQRIGGRRVREAAWTAVLCLTCGGCLFGQEPGGVEVFDDEDVSDDCFASGRFIGLERVEGECVLRLGTDSIGAWQDTFEGCGDGATEWSDLQVDAETPPGAAVEVSYRLMQDTIVPVGLPWTALEDDGGELPSRRGEFLDVRVELRPSSEGASPELRGVSVSRACR